MGEGKKLGGFMSDDRVRMGLRSDMEPWKEDKVWKGQRQEGNQERRNEVLVA